MTISDQEFLELQNRFQDAAEWVFGLGATAHIKPHICNNPSCKTRAMDISIHAPDDSSPIQVFMNGTFSKRDSGTTAIIIFEGEAFNQKSSENMKRTLGQDTPNKSGKHIVCIDNIDGQIEHVMRCVQESVVLNLPEYTV